MTEEPLPASRDAGVRRMLVRIALEILVGFVGVYAAFALTAYHERQAAAERRHQLKRALFVEVRQLTAVMRRNLTYRHELAVFDSAVKAGKKPIPHAFAQTGIITTHMWDATKESGGLSLIDVPTFALASNFYASVSGLFAAYAQLRELSVNVILPGSDRGPDAFYNPKTGKLRADIATLYYDDMNVAEGNARSAVFFGDSLLRTLARDTL
jgi:hypothetical protein